MEWTTRRGARSATKSSPRAIRRKICPENLLCKQDLLQVFGLPAASLKKPVIGIVSRFAGQKGFDLIEQIAPDLLAEDIAITALGAGEPRYEKLVRDLAKTYRGKFRVKVAYDNILAHKIEAGADIFLMPSRYEPCGLNQIYSLKYGTVPVVHATGGLDDTIDAFDPATGRGTGFKFKEYDGTALLDAIRQALSTFRNEPDVWRRIQLNGMARDFSWQASAKEYAKLYRAAAKSGIQKIATSSNLLNAKSAKMATAVPIGKGSHGR